MTSKKPFLVLFLFLLCIAFCIVQFGEYIFPNEEIKETREDLVNDVGETINMIASVKEENTQFDDILGFSGFYSDEIGFDTWTDRKYYAYSKVGSNKLIAESYGFGIRDYQIDIDGDGEKELLCSCTTGGDGHSELYVFKRDGDITKIGYVNWLKKGIDNLYFWGVNAVVTEYDSIQNDILVKYCSKENEDTYATLHLSFDVIDYIEWNGQDFPIVLQEEAYERYGEK